MSQITKRSNVVHGLDSGKPDERLLVVGDASSPSVRVLPMTFFASKSNHKQEEAEEAMRGVVFTGERGLELIRSPHPTPVAHDVVIEMKAAGMGGSDLIPPPQGTSAATGTARPGGGGLRTGRKAGARQGRVHDVTLVIPGLANPRTRNPEIAGRDWGLP